MQMDGTDIAAIATYGASGGYSVVGTNGDYNGDGKSDLVLRNADLGIVQVWEMNGTDIAAIGTHGASGGYSVVGTHGDYNGDGKSDILFRDSSSVVMFQMNGTDIGAVGSYTASAGWTVAGTDGDYNGDGKSDILLRNDVLADPGSLSMWQMNGTAIDAFGSATVGTGMRVVGVAATTMPTGCPISC